MEKKKQGYRLEQSLPHASKSYTPVTLLEIIEANVPKLADNQQLLFSILSYLGLLKGNPVSVNLSSLQILCLKLAKDQYCRQQIEDFITSIKGLKRYMGALSIQDAAELDSVMNTQKDALWADLNGYDEVDVDPQDSRAEQAENNGGPDFT